MSFGRRRKRRAAAYCPKGVLGLSASQSVSELKPDEAGPSHGSPESSQQSAGLCAAQQRG